MSLDKLTIQLPRDVADELRKRCASNGVNLSHRLRALERVCARHGLEDEVQAEAVAVQTEGRLLMARRRT